MKKLILAVVAGLFLGAVCCVYSAAQTTTVNTGKLKEVFVAGGVGSTGCSCQGGSVSGGGIGGGGASCSVTVGEGYYSYCYKDGNGLCKCESRPNP